VTPGRLALFFAYFIPGFLMFAGFYAAVGSLFTSEQEAQQAMAFMSLIIVIPMFLIQPVIMNPEATYVNVLTYIPPLTPFLMMLKMNSTAVPIWQYALTIGELVLFAGLVIYAAGKVFSTSILLYGKRPTVPEILRWIKA
jgi:ABC-2 type transport system permease protein